MRITDIREIAIPLKSSLRNSSFDFTEMTTSVVAVITDEGYRRLSDEEVAGIADRVIAARMNRPDGPAAALT